MKREMTPAQRLIEAVVVIILVFTVASFFKLVDFQEFAAVAIVTCSLVLSGLGVDVQLWACTMPCAVSLSSMVISVAVAAVFGWLFLPFSCVGLFIAFVFAAQLIAIAFV